MVHVVQERRRLSTKDEINGCHFSPAYLYDVAKMKLKDALDQPDFCFGHAAGEEGLAKKTKTEAKTRKVSDP